MHDNQQTFIHRWSNTCVCIIHFSSQGGQINNQAAQINDQSGQIKSLKSRVDSLEAKLNSQCTHSASDQFGWISSGEFNGCGPGSFVGQSCTFRCRSAQYQVDCGNVECTGAGGWRLTSGKMNCGGNHGVLYCT